MTQITQLGPTAAAALLQGRVKSSGYQELLGLRDRSPVPFRMKPAFDVAPRSLHQGNIPSFDEFKEAYGQLMEGQSRSGAVLVRGSSLQEIPGKGSRTIGRRFDPSDREGSVRRAYETTCQLMGTHEDMGVLVNPMVGSVTRLLTGEKAFGHSNVSFVADTHNPVEPNEMHIAVVNGWGTKAVDGKESILITVDRKSGYITSFINKADNVVAKFTGSLPCQELGDYRQYQRDTFDLESETPKSFRLNERFMESFFTRRRTAPTQIIGGKLSTGWTQDDLTHLESYDGFDASEIGRQPFHKASMLSHLIGILQFLAADIGPVQIEGAFPSPSSLKPYLYQLLRVDVTEQDSQPLSLQRPDLTSSQVIGRGKFKGPLVWITSKSYPDDVAELDSIFRNTGYALLANRHTLRLIDASPHCRVRLSASTENLSSHAVTLTRLRINEAPSLGIMMAMHCRFKSEDFDFMRRLNGKSPGSMTGDVMTFGEVQIESNGRELALEINP